MIAKRNFQNAVKATLAIIRAHPGLNMDEIQMILKEQGIKASRNDSYRIEDRLMRGQTATVYQYGIRLFANGVGPVPERRKKYNTRHKQFCCI